MCFFQSSREFNYLFTSKTPSKTSENYKNIAFRGRPGSDSTLMVDSVRVAQPIRLQHLH